MCQKYVIPEPTTKELTLLDYIIAATHDQLKVYTIGHPASEAMRSPLAVLIGHYFFGLDTKLIPRNLSTSYLRVEWPTIDYVK